MGTLTQTFTEVQHMMDRQMNPFRQDVVGDNSIEISADTETLFAVDGDARNVTSGPTYMTDRWDTTNNKMTAVAEYDSPIYVADVGFVWSPDASNAGTLTLRLYIDTSGTRNFATDPNIRTYTKSYKGASDLPLNELATWYWGEEAGYDAKNDGVYFTIEFEHSGDVTSPSLVIYNTQ